MPARLFPEEPPVAGIYGGELTEKMWEFIEGGENAGLRAGYA